MVLKCKCKTCREEFRFAGNYEHRQEISYRKGSEFPLKCPKCNREYKYKPAEIYAEKGKFPLLLLIAAIVGAYFLIRYFFLLTLPVDMILQAVYAVPVSILIPFMVYAAYAREQQNRVGTFNRS